jgi:hypothetical protein
MQRIAQSFEHQCSVGQAGELVVERPLTQSRRNVHADR